MKQLANQRRRDYLTNKPVTRIERSEMREEIWITEEISNAPGFRIALAGTRMVSARTII